MSKVANQRSWATAAALFVCLAIPASVLAQGNDDPGQGHTGAGGGGIRGRQSRLDWESRGEATDSWVDAETVLADDPAEDTDSFDQQQFVAGASSATLVPEEVFDPAFDRYVDLGLLVQAWDSKDPALLTDVALQLAEGERILLRPHKVISAEKLLGLALRAATERNDKAALDRLKNVAEKTGTESLQAQIAMNAKLGGESRAEDSMAMVSVHETTPLTYAVYHSLVNQIQTARIASDRELLEDTQKQIDAAVGLSEIQRDYLLKIMESAKSEIPEGMKTDPDIEALNKLSAGSRGWWQRATGTTTPSAIRKIAPKGISITPRETYSTIPQQPRYNRNNSRTPSGIVIDNKGNKPFQAPQRSRVRGGPVDTQHRYYYIHSSDGSVKKVPNRNYRP